MSPTEAFVLHILLVVAVDRTVDFDGDGDDDVNIDDVDIMLTSTSTGTAAAISSDCCGAGGLTL